MAQTFLNQFIRVQGNYPARDFRASGWVHLAQKPWWRDLVLYVLEYFEEEWIKIRLYEVVRATCYGIEINVPNFFTIFELYCPAMGTFFNLVGELGLALHEMREISNLPMGSMPHEVYFPCTIKLEKMEKDDPEIFKTYRKLMCHFYICMDIHNAHGNANEIKGWADYLFPILDGAPEDVQFPISKENIRQQMISNAHKDVISEENDRISKKGDKFKSFHYQAKYPMSQKALLTSFLSV